jgi:hypothetical protein
MLNTSGVLAVLDRGMTINWDDGPTLHRMTAQVRYHTATLATSQLVRIHATQRHSDEPLTFVQDDDVVHVVWAWHEYGAPDDDAPGSPYWSVQLSVTNKSEEDIYLDTLDVIRIDGAYAGQFNLGAPPGLWRCARENPGTRINWEAWSESSTSAGGFTRNTELLVQPSVSNRSRPPAVLIRALADTEVDSQATGASMSTEIKLEINGERFERMVARSRADGTRLGPSLTRMSAEYLVASGDNAEELRQLVISNW